MSKFSSLSNAPFGAFEIASKSLKLFRPSVSWVKLFSSLNAPIALMCLAAWHADKSKDFKCVR